MKGICTHTIVPIRKDPVHQAEIVSQLLFGEVYTIEKKQSDWYYIQCAYDQYNGWIHHLQHTEASEKDFKAVTESTVTIAYETSSQATSGFESLNLVCGSTLPYYDGLNLRIGKEKYIYNGQAIPAKSISKNQAIEKIALRYLHAPYLWGGRSPFGIDCSGFTQLVYKFLSIPLWRDAYLQATQGTALNFLEECEPGDLAFFGNEEGRITHVGIILKEGKIIHASGKVRIDKIDHFGIYNSDSKKYTHQLKSLRRIE